MRKFLFLYPIEEIIGFEIERWGWAEEGGKEKFREKYKNMLNECIDLRYRKNGFEINYVVFHGSSVSDIIQIQPTDKIIEVEIDFETHKTKSLYPNEDFILDRLGPEGDRYFEMFMRARRGKPWFWQDY